MGEACCHHPTIPRIINPIDPKPRSRFHHLHCRAIKSNASTSSINHDNSQDWRKVPGRPQKPHKPLIKLSTSGTSWTDEWSAEYAYTLRELRLSDLAQEGEEDAEVFIGLSIQKHAGFGFSVEGRIITSFTSRCSSCFSPYNREIDRTFRVWVLPSSKTEEFELPEIGGNDPSVIYVKPGSEADLDSLIQDTIRLTASAKDTCSASCEKSTMRWQYGNEKRAYDPRWARLLEIKASLE